MIRRSVLLAGLLSLAASCTKSAVPPPAPSAEVGTVELGALMRRVHFGFRQQADELVGGHLTYESGLDARGRLRVSPVHDGKLASLWLRTEGPGARPLLDAEGGARIHRGEMIEEVENTERGVEQRWRFAVRPRGPVTLHVEAGGMRYVGRTAAGLHFRDEATGLGVRYSDATWIDARGERTPITARHLDGRIVLEVPGPLLERSSFPAVLDPVASPEFGIDQPIIGAAGGNQRTPEVASDGSGFLVAWTDQRALASDVWAARVDAAGSLLDPDGLQLCVLPGGQTVAAVVWTGAHYLVLWGDTRNGGTDLYGARITAAGVNRDPDGLPILTGPGSAPSAVRVASDGTSYLLVWPGVGIQAARIDGNGGVLTQPFTVHDSPDNDQVPSASWNGTNYLVAWETGSVGMSNNFWDLFGARISAAGAPLDTTPIALATTSQEERAPSLTSDGVNHIVTYLALSGSGSDVVLTRVSGAGAVLDSPPVVVKTSASTKQRPHALWDGANVLIGWNDDESGNHDILATRRTAAGASASGILTLSAATNIQRSVRLAASATQILAAWEDERTSAGVTDIYAARLSGNATLEPSGLLISRGSNQQGLPAVARGRSQYLVVWQDQRGTTGWDLYAARLDDAGTVLDPNGLLVTAAAGDQRAAQLASDGTNYFVTWEENSTAGNIYGTLVTGAGQVRDPGGLLIADTADDLGAPTVASDGSSFLVAWASRKYTSTLGDLYAGRISAAGTLLGTFTLSAAGEHQETPAAAWDGTNYFVAWADRRNLTYDLFGARVSPAGAVLDTGGLPLHVAAGDQQSPRIAFGGGRHLITWSEAGAVLGLRVTQSGTIDGDAGFGIASTGGQQAGPRQAWNGQEFVVVWRDTKPDGGVDVLGARVSDAGALLDPAGFPIAAESFTETEPSVASAGDGEALVVYARPDLSPGYGSTRVRARFVRPGSAANLPLGAACALGGQCASGFCASQVCCDAPCSGACELCSSAGTCSLRGTQTVCRAADGGCDLDERCDGASADCPPDAVADAGTLCLASGCADATSVLPPSYCDGVGAACVPAPAVSCAPYACAAGQCAASCSTADPCGSGFFCESGACRTTRDAGEPCTPTGGECGPLSCSNAVCCDRPCAGPCESCALPGAEGTCTPLPLGAAATCPDGLFCHGDAGECGCQGTTDCDGGLACQAGRCVRPGSPVIIREAAPSGTVGVAYEYSDGGRVRAVGDPIIVFEACGGPPELALDPATGELSWIPIAPGDQPLCLRARNPLGADEYNFTVKVAPAPPTDGGAAPDPTAVRLTVGCGCDQLAGLWPLAPLGLIALWRARRRPAK